MSVATSRNVRIRNYQGLPDDTRYPTGDFLCAMQVVGDATGGTVTLTAIATAQIASKYVWHLQGFHLGAVTGLGGNVLASLGQTGGESEYVDQGIVPGHFITLYHPGAGPNYDGMNFVPLPAVMFPITEVRNGLTLTWTFTLEANVNGVVYQASIFGHVYRRNIFRNGGPLIPL